MNYHTFKTKKTTLALFLDATPIKKQKWSSFCNHIDIVEVKVPHLCICVPTRADKPKSPYLKPIIDEFEMDIGGELSVLWKVLKITNRKGDKNSDGYQNVVPKSPGSRIPWNILVLYKDEVNLDSKTIGKHLSTELTKFVQECPKVRELF